MRAIIPLKAFDQAKQRLAGILTLEQRRQFFCAMVEDVLAVVSSHAGIDEVLLLSDEPLAPALAEQYGVEHLSEQSLQVAGLNSVLQAAVEKLAREGVEEVIILHGDLPLLTHAELDELLAAYRGQTEPAMLAVPDRHGTGTNCLVFPSASTPRFCFGPDSCRQHREQAQQLGLRFIELDLPGAGSDIDLPADLQNLLDQKNTQRTIKSIRYLLDAVFTSSPGSDGHQSLAESGS